MKKKTQQTKSSAKAGVKKKGKVDVADAEKPVAEDWLGDAASDEDDILSGSGEDAEMDDESGKEADEPCDTLAMRDEDNDGGFENEHQARSKMLAKLESGQQPADLAAIKQRIESGATVLSDWRKAKDLGETRTRDEVMEALVSDCSTYYGYSEELADYFLKMFSPEQAIEFFEANEKSRPMTIRTNSLKARRQTLIQSLTARKVTVDAIGPWTKVGLKVYDSAVPVGATPEYLGGQYMIQSASSLVPVMALAPQQDETILDMAAAPGGKTTYIGQLMKNTGTLFANDLRKDRCKSLMANCHRMGLTNVVGVCMDGRKLGKIMPKLDRVLLDAPCSGSGIIARDPSVKAKRGTKDFEENSTLQKELLATAIDMVDAKSKTGGYIVYSTCSVSVEENEAVVEHALKTRNVELVTFSSSVNFGVEGMVRYREKRFHQSMNLCRRYYPHVHNMDGFFVAKFKKLSNEIPDRAKKDRRKGGGDTFQVWGEEKWTSEMMDNVIDFEEPEDKAQKKPLNKIERKKLKRQAQLEARAAETKNAQADSKEAPTAKPKQPVQNAAKDSTSKANESANTSKVTKVKKVLKRKAAEETGDAKNKKEGKKVEEDAKSAPKGLKKKKKKTA